MRQLRRLGTVAAALTAVVALGACGSATEEPGGASPDDPTSTGLPESDPVDLVNMWRVTGAQGEEDPAWLRLDAGEFMLWRDCGYLLGSWDAGSRLFTADTYGASGGCDAELVIEWLHDARAYQPTDDGWELLDDTGAVVASLSIDGAPEPIPDAAPELAEAPEVTDDTRAAMQPPAPLPDGSSPATAEDLLGRWIPAEDTANDPYVQFEDDGTWGGSDGCNGSGGRWQAGEDGELLVTSGPTTLIGCDGAPVPSWVAGARTAALEDDTLLLYDRDGELLAELVRD